MKLFSLKTSHMAPQASFFWALLQEAGLPNNSEFVNPKMKESSDSISIPERDSTSTESVTIVTEFVN